MPDTLRLNDGGYMRRFDVQKIIGSATALQCMEVVGFSNVGKSALLRLLAQRDVWTQEIGEAGHDFQPVYLDCNRMLDLSDQGFYELVLRCLRESHEELATNDAVQEAYAKLIAPESDFQIPLSFNQGVTAALKSTPRKIVLLFDEFDEPFSHIHSRVFLNLRALKDRHAARLVYVTATVLPLTKLRQEDHSSEFCELFSHRTWYLAPLTRMDQERFIQRYMHLFEARFASADIDFISTWSGGHPRMLDGVCRVLTAYFEDADGEDTDAVDRWQLHRNVVRRLRNDEILQSECRKIWASCSDGEQAELLGLFRADHTPNQAVLDGLERRHILLHIDGAFRPFARLFGEFLQRMVVNEQPESASLWVDVDSGEVVINGTPVEMLTNLEYRLMLLLFQNANKIVDKYQIVTQVWGESYLDDVDDARIEKLVSRLRQKIEHDSGNPQFLTTVRGRGYRLVLE
jgi:DNA-binding winged helix-turn-helix (wHTH) protein